MSYVVDIEKNTIFTVKFEQYPYKSQIFEDIFWYFT